jgi:hypothetical protein
MEKDLKDILLKDLCARLPYKVQASYYGSEEECETWDEIEGVESSGHVEIGQYILPIEKIKPYLFPLSSMTEEQSMELFKLFGISLVDSDYIKINECTGITFFLNKGFDVETHLDKLMNWLNTNHFDYRGLIPMGLAIDATNKNIY